MEERIKYACPEWCRIVAAEVAEALAPIGAKVPESQARELADLRDNPERNTMTTTHMIAADAPEYITIKQAADALAAAEWLEAQVIPEVETAGSGGKGLPPEINALADILGMSAATAARLEPDDLAGLARARGMKVSELLRQAEDAVTD